MCEAKHSRTILVVNIYKQFRTLHNTYWTPSQLLLPRLLSLIMKLLVSQEQQMENNFFRKSLYLKEPDPLHIMKWHITH